MQTQWEYCELRLDIASGVMHNQYISFYRVNGQTEEVKITSRENAIARLGAEGWEMIGTAGSLMGDGGGLLIFFKRPISQTSDE
ncbi:MAG: hypothetical protein JXB47_02310 [Anaerolineae bacterium]|nr:hypothetical protein [Anaerolineae bacterium]